jgi:hypothetical protein
MQCSYYAGTEVSEREKEREKDIEEERERKRTLFMHMPEC